MMHNNLKKCFLKLCEDRFAWINRQNLIFCQILMKSMAAQEQIKALKIDENVFDLTEDA